MFPCLREGFYDGKDQKEKVDNLVAYLDRESFEYYFDNFVEDKVPIEETKLFHRIKAALLGNYSTKKRETEVMKEVLNFV